MSFQIFPNRLNKYSHHIPYVLGIILIYNTWVHYSTLMCSDLICIDTCLFTAHYPFPLSAHTHTHYRQPPCSSSSSHTWCLSPWPAGQCMPCRSFNSLPPSLSPGVYPTMELDPPQAVCSLRLTSLPTREKLGPARQLLPRAPHSLPAGTAQSLAAW